MQKNKFHFRARFFFFWWREKSRISAEKARMKFCSFLQIECYKFFRKKYEGDFHFERREICSSRSAEEPYFPKWIPFFPPVLTTALNCEWKVVQLALQKYTTTLSWWDFPFVSNNIFSLRNFQSEQQKTQHFYSTWERFLLLFFLYFGKPQKFKLWWGRGGPRTSNRLGNRLQFFML